MGAALVFTGKTGDGTSYSVYERAAIQHIYIHSLGKAKGYEVTVILVTGNSNSFVVGSNPKAHIAAFLEGTGPCTLALKE